MRRTSTCLILAMFMACGGGEPTANDGIASVRMNANAISLFEGQKEQLAASPRDASGIPVASPPMTVWSSGNSAIASVTQSGEVTALANGQTDIFATIGSKRGATRVTVGEPPTSVLVSMPGNSFTPYTSTIKVGGVVRFEFPQTPHNVIFSPKTGAPTDIQSTASTTISKTFNTVGLFPYDCTLHDGMKGEVNVVP